MKLSYSQNRAQHSPRKRKGFSLVEVIIAIGIVALLLTGFLGVFGSAQKNINRSLGVKEANMLKDSLETEMSTLRSNEVGSAGVNTAAGTDTGKYTSSFHKAYKMIENSHTRDQAILVYQYKAEPEDKASAGSTDDDGILPAFDGANGIQGKNYLTQVAVRKLGRDNELMEKELSNKTVVGNVYAVRMTQLIKNTTSGDLELSGDVGVIKHQVGNSNVSSTDHNQYNKAVITFQAEFFRIPSNSFGYVKSSNWDFIKMGNPVAVVNMAIRR